MKFDIDEVVNNVLGSETYMEDENLINLMSYMWGKLQGYEHLESVGEVIDILGHFTPADYEPE